MPYTIDDAEELYNKYSSLLYGYVLSQVPNKVKADKIFQLSFINAVTNIGSVDETKIRLFTCFIRSAIIYIAEERKITKEHHSVSFNLITSSKSVK